MKAKIYVLTCVNENEEIVTLRSFKDLKSAQITMREGYEYERKEAEENDDLAYSDLGELTAKISYNNDLRYTWEIHATTPFSDMDELIMGDILRHLELEGAGGWVRFLKELIS